MVDSTRNVMALREVKELLAIQLDTCLVELAGSIQCTSD